MNRTNGLIALVGGTAFGYVCVQAGPIGIALLILAFACGYLYVSKKGSNNG